MNAQINALCQPQAATVEQETYKAVRRAQLSENGFGLGMGEDDGDVPMAFGTNHSIELAELAAQYVTIKEEERIEGLILRGCGDAMPDGQLG